MPESISPATPTTPAGACRALVLGLAVAWAGLGLLAEQRAALAGFDGRERWSHLPVSWRPGMPQVERLAACLDAARSGLPAAGPEAPEADIAAVAFASPADAGGSAFFRSRWAAYLMPERDVVAWDDPHAPAAAGWVIAFRQDLSDSRLEPAGRWPGCRLYRVRR